MSPLARLVRGLVSVAIASLGGTVVLVALVLSTDLDLTYLYVAAGILIGTVAAVVAYVMILKRNDWLYRREVGHGLDAAFESSRGAERTLDLDSGRPLIILSDQHKGTRDGADDFWRSERAYCAALAYYFALGHHLVCLGDAEELWETWTASKIIRAHEGEGQAFELEARFYDAERYDRVWGNHDLLWTNARSTAAYLGQGGPFGPGFAVSEAVKFRVVSRDRELGTLFLVHGHQGTADSQIFPVVSRFAVRIFGLLQRRFRRGWNTPANDWSLRARHDEAMIAWAKGRSAERIVLIAGHTHRPVFWDRRRRVPGDATIDALAAGIRVDEMDEEAAQRHADLEWARAERRWGQPPPKPLEVPCYFNAGCCSFSDGDITGLEIVDGVIRLVRWPNDHGEPRPKILEPASAELDAVFDAVEKFAASVKETER